MQEQKNTRELLNRMPKIIIEKVQENSAQVLHLTGIAYLLENPSKKHAIHYKNELYEEDIYQAFLIWPTPSDSAFGLEKYLTFKIIKDTGQAKQLTQEFIATFTPN